nr:hypothetical protein [Clostridia bacterium]
MKYTYHAMHMHLHAGNQPGASFESHMYNAAQLSMKYIRFTGHDSRTGPKAVPCDSFDFSRGERVYCDVGKQTCGWEETIGEPDVTFDGNAM